MGNEINLDVEEVFYNLHQKDWMGTSIERFQKLVNREELVKTKDFLEEKKTSLRNVLFEFARNPLQTSLGGKYIKKESNSKWFVEYSGNEREQISETPLSRVYSDAGVEFLKEIIKTHEDAWTEWVYSCGLFLPKQRIIVGYTHLVKNESLKARLNGF